MNVKLLKNALPWLVLAVLLPVLALLFTAGPVGAAGCCGGTPPPADIVRVYASPSGGGDVEVAGRLPASYPFVRLIELGEKVSLEATPADDYYFVGWSGDLTGNENPTEIIIVGETTITAQFFPEEIVSDDSVLQIVFPAGTIVQDRDGAQLFGIELAVADTPPPPPPEAYIVGLPYELGPNGATFNRPAMLHFSYDPDEIPPGVAEADLDMGYYDDEAAQWLVLPSGVDIVKHTISTRVDHLSTFAVIAPAPPPPPAAFTTSALNISPLETDIGETVTISALVTNTGELEGSYSVTLAKNGVVEETAEITLASGSQTVTFSTAGDEAGTYSVDVNGLEGSFTVREAPILSSGLSGAVMWTILGLAIAALMLAVIFFIVKMRRRYDDDYYY